MGLNDFSMRKTSNCRQSRIDWTRGAVTTIGKTTMNRSSVSNSKPSNSKQNELFRWTAIGQGAIDEGITRRRAQTTVTTGLNKNPLSRMNQRLSPPTLAQDLDSALTSLEKENNALTESFLRDSLYNVDTNEQDPTRHTFDDETKMFIPATPPIPPGMTIAMLPTADESALKGETGEPRSPVSTHTGSTTSPRRSSSIINIATPHDEVEEDPVEEEQAPEAEEDATGSAFIDVESEEEEDEEAYAHGLLFDIDEDASAFDVCDNFDAILGEPLPHRASRWRFSMTRTTPSKEIVVGRAKRGMSTPVEMNKTPVLQLTRQVTEPASYTSKPRSQTTAAMPLNQEHAEPLYHGQTLHLAFKSSNGQLVEVSGDHKRFVSPKTLFSKLIRCHPLVPHQKNENDALRIIAHTTDSYIRGGDRISLARADGSVLRMQIMSKRLGFSPKIDLKAKFIVSGVPEGTIVTDKTKFYLQSVYDRSKTVGFLASKRRAGTGALVMYAYRTMDEKSEPIQLFKRPEETIPWVEDTTMRLFV